VDAHHGIPAAGLGLAHRPTVPFDVAEQVVNGLLGVSLAPASPNHRDLGMRLEETTTFIQPAVNDLAVAVYEEDIWQLRPGFDQLPKPLVAGAGGGEGRLQIELYDLDAQCATHLDGVVTGAGVHVDDALGSPEDRFETAFQTLAFVAADDHDANRARGVSVLTHEASRDANCCSLPD